MANDLCCSDTRFLKIGILITSSFIISFGSVLTALSGFEPSFFLWIMLWVSGGVALFSFFVRMLFCSSSFYTNTFFTRKHILSNFTSASLLVLAVAHLSVAGLLFYAGATDYKSHGTCGFSDWHCKIPRGFAYTCSFWHLGGGIALALSALIHFINTSRSPINPAMVTVEGFPISCSEEQRFRFDRIV